LPGGNWWSGRMKVNAALCNVHGSVTIDG